MIAPGGLTSTQAKSLLARHGPNALPEREPESFIRRFLRQFQNPLIYILLFALAVDSLVWVKEGAHGLPLESIVIGLILLLNAGLGVWQESKAEASLKHLRQLSMPQSWALRDGSWIHVPSADLVPGDVVRLEQGDRIPADGTVAGAGIAIDESILTGESAPVEKNTGEEGLSGTLVVRGKTYLEVSRTGPGSTLGKLAGMLGDVVAESTPLERRLHVLARQIAVAVLLLSVAILVESVISEGLARIDHAFLFAVALAVAAVPEGLPAVLTLALALGVERMAGRKAVVRRLAAVESLGSVTVIATDKTGTLTENRMMVRDVISESPDEALKALVVANEADQGVGDPMDIALLEYAASKGANPAAILRSLTRVSERAFDSADKFMRVSVEEAGRTVSYLKGAPEVLLSRAALSPEQWQRWQAEVARHAAEGFRLLGIARGNGETETGLEFLGLALFWDPPRAEVPDAIRRAREAGVRVIMLTGDHPATAAAIARRIGIPGDVVATGEEIAGDSPGELAERLKRVSIFARVRPEHKLRIVESLQASGEIVSMTGDGVNDAPALKRSSVGVAMGQRGSDVSREVADLVLLDDNFATIVAAIEEGRGIYENIQKFIRFLFSTNLSEVLVVSVGVLVATLMNLRDATGNLLLPLTAVQILWINLVTDGLPALALALDRNPGVMTDPPRSPSAPLLDSRSRRFIVVSGVIKGLFALSMLGTAQLGWLAPVEARTAAFHFMAMGQLLFAYPARHTAVMPLPNPVLHVAVVAGVLLQIATGSLGFSMRLLDLAPLSAVAWAGVIGLAAAAWLCAEAVTRLVWRHR